MNITNKEIGLWLFGVAFCVNLQAQTLPKPDENGTYLFWTPEEQLLGYRNIEKIFPTRTIERGDHVKALPSAEQSIDPRYKVDGETWNVEAHMEAVNAVGILAIHKGEIILERYRADYGPEQRWTSFSVGKSITSTLAGAALKDGYIKSLEDPITDYLPGLKDSDYEGVTVEQLLTMTSGIAWNEDYSDPTSDVAMIRAEKSVNGSDPIVTYMAKLKREAEPGTKWVYKTGETNLVGSLVSAATGKTLAEYLSEKIWSPYGMEKDAIWMLNAGGVEYGGCCVSATLRDFGRFGLFFLNGATMNDESIVADGWIEAATTSADAAINSDGGGYGYQWWVTNGPAFRAVGIFGQMIYINPELDLVVVTQGAYKTATGRELSQRQGDLIDAIETAVSER